MPNGKKVKKKLNKRIIKRYGINTYLLRTSASSTNLNRYGEPIGGESSYPFSRIDIRIVIEVDKRDLSLSEIGGLSDDKRELIYFYCSGDDDIRIGDFVIYPPNSQNRWLIENIWPNMMNDVVVINEVKAYKDDRY